MGRPFEILVVDAATPLDSTAEDCAALGARCVARSPRNVYGDAARTGLHEARGVLIGFMDADGSHAPEQLSSQVEAMPGQGVVVGSRYEVRGHRAWRLKSMARDSDGIPSHRAGPYRNPEIDQQNEPTARN